MKRIVLAIVFLASALQAQIPFSFSDVPAVSSVNQVVGSASYLVQQDFESAGTPSGWTGFAGTFTFHNTSSPLEGTGDLTETGGSAQCYVQYTAQTEAFIVFLWKAVTLPSANANVFGFYDASFANEVCGFNVTTAGAIRGLCKGTQYAVFGANISAATLYYVKVHYKAGSGSNAACSVEFSTSGTWTGSGNFFISTTTGTATTSTTDADWLNDAGSSVFHIDHVRISTTDLGSTFSSWP